jgi:OOP family OmpA-OmpF porin
MKRNTVRFYAPAAMCLAFAASVPVAAHADSGWYMGAEGGVNWMPRQSHATAGSHEFSLDYDTGWIGGLTTGYAFENGLRPELELDYRRNSIATLFLNGMANPASGRAYTESAFANLWYDIKTNGGFFSVFHPYLGIGGGVARVNFGNLATNAGPVINDHDTVLAYQGGAGLGYDINRRLTLSLDYRFMGTEKGDYNYSGAVNGFGGAQPVSVSYTTNSVMLGLRYTIAEAKPADSDSDGVPDERDACPDTPPGTAVDAHGCPRDTDHDGVPDSSDQCPNTPSGVSVDAKGCPTDSDGDGVPDSLDQCPNTPQGVSVDAKGCPADSDGDGVPDSQDQCPNTPKGTPVDAKGCPADSDGDGVPDNEDQCPNTPHGDKVMANGCSAGQALILKDVHFDFGKARLTPDSKTVLDRVAKTIVASPGFKIEIAGYTDSIGSSAYNLKLSNERANAVRIYLLSQGVSPDTVIAKGYGESDPVATNKTDEGRAQNRRVEMHVIGEQLGAGRGSAAGGGAGNGAEGRASHHRRRH